MRLGTYKTKIVIKYAKIYHHRVRHHFTKKILSTAASTRQ